MPSIPGQHHLMRAWGAALSALNTLFRLLSQPTKWKCQCQLLAQKAAQPTLKNFMLALVVICCCNVLVALISNPAWWSALITRINDAWLGLLGQIFGSTRRNASEPCTTSVEACGLVLPDKDRFLTFNMHGHGGPNEDEVCGGLGNQIFRLTGMYGIGRRVGRRPYFANEVVRGGLGEARGLCMMRLWDELESIFPDMLPLLHKVDPPPINSTVVITGYSCCLFEDVIPQLSQVPEAMYVRLHPGDNYQHYWYFAGYEKEVAGMMRFNKTLSEKVAESVKKIFGDDTTSHKLCIHSRRGDFMDTNWHTKMPFVVGAIDLIAPMLKYSVSGRSERRNISLVMHGEDRPFLQRAANYAENQTNYFHKVYVVQLASRGEDLCFGATYCDSVVITASHSTFSWWISFLVWMNGRGPIFYDGALFNSGLHGRSNFPSEWIPVKYVGGGEDDKADVKAKVVIDEPKSLQGYATGLSTRLRLTYTADGKTGWSRAKD